MDKNNIMYVCVGETDKNKRIFSNLLDIFIEELVADGIISDYSIFTQSQIKKECEEQDEAYTPPLLMDSSIVMFITEEQGYEIDEKMRAFLNKVSDWSYTMPLIGKLGILVTVCNDKELLITTNYMMKLMSSWGTGVVGRLICCESAASLSDVKEQIRDISRRIKKLQGEADFTVTDSQKANFEIKKRAISKLDDSNHLKQYWKSHRYLEARDFQYLFNSKKTF